MTQLVVPEYGNTYIAITLISGKFENLNPFYLKNKIYQVVP